MLWAVGGTASETDHASVDVSIEERFAENKHQGITQCSRSADEGANGPKELHRHGVIKACDVIERLANLYEGGAAEGEQLKVARSLRKRFEFWWTCAWWMPRGQ
jgi:hypothetical protein